MSITIEELFEEICEDGSIYMDIIHNIIRPNNHLVGAVLSELSYYWFRNPVGPLEAYENKTFKFYFINSVKNQVHSSTSAFHKNNRTSLNDKTIRYDTDTEEIYSEDDTDLEDKILVEERLEQIEMVLSKIDITWFQREMFRSYYFPGPGVKSSYRKISDKYGMNHIIVYDAVNIVVEKIKDYLN